MTTKQKKCADLIDGQLRKTMADVRKLWRLYQKDPEATDDRLGNFNDYGLSLAVVNPEDGPSYVQWQLSWGGPSDEFRFYMNSLGNCYSTEYVYMDWYDGAKKLVLGEDRALLMEIFEDWKDCGSVEAWIEQAKAE